MNWYAKEGENCVQFLLLLMSVCLSKHWLTVCSDDNNNDDEDADCKKLLSVDLSKKKADSGDSEEEDLKKEAKKDR